MKHASTLLFAVLAAATLVVTAQGGVVQADLRALTTSGTALIGLSTNGNLVRSTDGGANFTTTRTATSVALQNVVASGTTVLAVGDSGLIVRSTDGGQAWTDLDTTAAPALTAGELRDAATSNGTFWVAVGRASGNLAIEWSDNGGATWSAATSIPTLSGTLNGVCFDTTTGRWTAVGSNGTFDGALLAEGARILTSTDGKNWTAVTSTGIAALNDVATDGSGNLLAVGAGGTLITSSNGGSSFAVDANSGAVTESLNAVVYSSAGWTAGGDDLVQVGYTVGGGAAVTQTPVPGGGNITALAVDSGGQVAVSGGNFSTVATVTLGNLSATYDGNPKSVTATTNPPDLNVTFTYNGQSNPPTNAGSYAVQATINSGQSHTGGASGTLVIAKAGQTITFAPLNDVNIAVGTVSLSASSSASLPITFSVQSGPATVSGSTLTLTGSGTVVVRASQAGNTNYNAASNVDRSFNVTTSSATVTLGNLSATYDGNPHSATATTTPGGLTVNFTYNGSSNAPTNAGSYDVVATVVDQTYSGSATGTLVIAKANQTINFTGPANQAYSTTPITLSATASSGLTVTFSVTSGPAQISGNSLTLLGAGTVVVEAAQAGGTNYNAATPVSRSFTVAGDFETWRIEHFTTQQRADLQVSGPNAVLTGDGFPNLMRYALGLDPVQPVGAAAPASSATETNWVLTYSRPAATTDLTYTVEASTDLVSWSSSGVTHVMVGSSNGTQQWQATYPRASASRLFLRLKVTRASQPQPD
jgi:photosystem II stability/assembly factor-like uncharacterized protein